MLVGDRVRRAPEDESEAEAGALEFERPDTERFECLALAYRALEAGGAAPAVLNAANEVAVEAFLNERARFMDIPAVIAETLDRHAGDGAAGIEELLAADGAARRTAEEILSRGASR